MYRPDYIPNKRLCIKEAVEKLKAEQSKFDVPDLIQGEVARLNSKYLISLDKKRTDESGNIHLLCRLGKCFLIDRLV